MKKMECSFEGCSRPVRSVGLCRAHYKQKWLGQELTPIKDRVRRDENGRVCTACNEYKPYSEFYLQSGTGKPRANCKVCANEKQNSYYLAKK